MTQIRIGTRGSPLALVQAELTKTWLQAAWPELKAPDAVAIVPIRTSGDRIQDRPLAEAGGKGLFTKEIEEALLAGAVDIAVHSLKDVETKLPDGLVIDGGRPLRGAAVRAHDDHRIAMSLAVAALGAEGETEIEGGECASVSFPEFWDLLARGALRG